ncbi:MAG: CheY-like chemotaxis protein [Planctomycetota bacterium]
MTLDVMMPGMDGWEVLRDLKADPALSGIPVVMITIAGERELGYSLGAVDYLTKPVDRKLLLKVVRELGGTHALIVEDDRATRELMAKSLKAVKMTVDVAENGAVALERVAKRAPDVILLDLMMPVMDGFEFVQRLRRDSKHSSIPIIVVTAKDLTAEDRGQLSGAVQQILMKSEDPDAVLQQVCAIASNLRGPRKNR